MEEEEEEEEEEGPPKPKNQTDEFSLCDTENRFDVAVVRPSFVFGRSRPPSLPNSARLEFAAPQLW